MSAPNGSADSQKTVFISMKVGSPEHHRPFLFTGTRDKMPKESRNSKHFLLNVVHSPISKLPHDCLVYSPNMKSLHGQIKTSCWIHTKRAPCILKANKKTVDLCKSPFPVRCVASCKNPSERRYRIPGLHEMTGHRNSKCPRLPDMFGKNNE